MIRGILVEAAASRSCELLQSPEPIFMNGISMLSKNFKDVRSMGDAENNMPISEANFFNSINCCSVNSRCALCSPYVSPHEFTFTYDLLNAALLNFSLMHVFWNFTQSAPLS